MKMLNLVFMRENSIRYTIRVLMTEKKHLNEVSVIFNAKLKINIILKTIMV